MSHPGDIEGFRELVLSEEARVEDIQGIILTHEGDWMANAYATYAYADFLSEQTGQETSDLLHTIPIQAMAGAVGFMVPHAAILTRKHVAVDTGISERARREKRLVVGGACTRRFAPEEVGTETYIREVEQRVRELAVELEVASPEDVHLVFAKAPWPGAHHRGQARSRGESLPGIDFSTMGRLARGGAVLGIALALGEIEDPGLAEDIVLQDRENVYSTIAQCTSSEDRESTALIMVANSPAATSDYVVAHGVLEDGLDTEGVKAILRDVGLQFECCPSAGDRERVKYAFLKAKTSETQRLRGCRHTLTDHPTVGHLWWMIEKAPVHAVVASILGTTMFQVATGPEHQGPLGHPLLAVVARA